MCTGECRGPYSGHRHDSQEPLRKRKFDGPPGATGAGDRSRPAAFAVPARRTGPRGPAGAGRGRPGRPLPAVCPGGRRVPVPRCKGSAARAPGARADRNTHREEEARMTGGTETGGVTGTQDKDYNLIWYVESCLNNALRLETYIQDAERAEDTEVAELFRKAQADSRKGAELGKNLLRARLNGG
ncbi:hypothetical protein GCM10010421_44650 [Streptomyces glaucus]|uniref:Ferritin/DPS protein domain-containing protein n=2 Tax=Streptomyces glaucus TaxID=284029 RepID=A0ABP5XB44_9ACTN